MPPPRDGDGRMGDDLGMLVMRSGSLVLQRRPSKPYVSAWLANLQPGRSVILERIDKAPGDWYVQISMRQGNTFLLAYQDGAPTEYYVTRTVSREKVITATLGWMKGDSSWREPFTWDNIGSRVGDEEADEGVTATCPSEDS